MEIDHVQIAIPRGGEPEARNFYSGLLGLTEIAKPQALNRRGGCWFQTANIQLHLGVDPDFRPAKKAHVALKTSRLKVLRARIEEAGFETQYEEVVDGKARFFCCDPFGNRLEFID